MNGQAFMFTPGGPVAIPQEGVGGPLVGPSDDVLANVPILTAFRSPPDTAIAPVQQQLQLPGHAHAAVPAAVVRQLGPRDVVREARARAKEIRAEIRRLKGLERQLTELERLIAAAKQKPVAIVRDIDHARRQTR